MIINIILSLLLLLSLSGMLFDISKYAKVSRIYNYWFVLPLFLVLGVFLYLFRVNFIINLLLVLASLFFFSIAFQSDRKYIYIFAFGMLILSPIFTLLKLHDYAVYSAAVCFLLFVVILLKEVMYERLFKI